MADSSFPITPGSGSSGSVDTRTESTNSHIRQVVVLGDPAINANVAAVLTQDGLNTDETTPALAVRTVGSLSVNIAGATGTVGVYLSASGGTLQVKTDPSSVLSGITSSIAVYLQSTSGTVITKIDPDSTVRVNGLQGTTVRPFIMNTDGAIKVYDLVAGTVTANVAGSLTGITNSIQVHLLSTNGTIAANIGKVDGTVTVRLDPGYTLGNIQNINNSISVHLGSTGGTIWVKPDPAGTYFTNGAHTSSIFTVSGSTSGGTTSGVTLVAPSANYSFKVFAYSLQTTGAVSQAIRFTNGGGSETELWRPLVTASGVTGAQGANLAVQPPGFIFATGASTTLAIKNDSGSLIHYSVSYIKESA
ncbi:MAG: hypothetical protein WAV09_01110 [Minisyncoccia bacterium]